MPVSARVPVVPVSVDAKAVPTAHPDGTVTWEPPTPGANGANGAPGTLTLSSAATPNQAADLKTKLGLTEPSILGRGGQTVYDDFNRADGPLNGSQAVTGQVWRAQGNAVIPAVASGKLSFAGTVPSTPNIGYIDLGDVNEIECSYTFDGTGTTHAENVVLGFAQSAFAPASIQIFHYARTALVDIGDGHGATTSVDWLVQAIYIDGGGQEYTTLAHGLWSNSYTPPLDGVTKIKHRVRRVNLNTIAVPLPDGTVQMVTNTLIGQYFGTTMGVQLRRRNTTDGYASFLYVAGASGAPVRFAQPTPGSDLYIPGDGASYMATAGPGVSITDFDIRVIVNPATVSAGTDLVSCWDPVLGRMFDLSFTAAGNPFFRVWSDGTSSSQMGTSSTAAAPNGGTSPYCLGVSRVGSTGALNYYITTDLTAVDYPLTDSRWGTAVSRTSTAGSSFASGAPLMIGYPATGNGYAGTIRYLAVRSGLNGTILAGFDLRKPFTGRGLAQELWHIHGSGWSWRIPEAAVSGLTTDLAALQASITALGAGLYKAALTSSVTASSTTSAANNGAVLWAPTTVPPASLTAHVSRFVLRLHGSNTADAALGTPINTYVFIGSTQISVTATLTTSAAVTNTWEMLLELYVDATGSSGSVTLGGMAHRDTATGTTITPSNVQVVGTTVDLSAGLSLVIKTNVPQAATTANSNTLVRASFDQTA